MYVLVVIGNMGLASSLITVTASAQNASATPDADPASPQNQEYFKADQQIKPCGGRFQR